MSTTTTTTTAAAGRTGPSTSPWRPAALAVAAAVVLAAATFTAARLTGADLVVSPPGRTPAPVPFGAVLVAAVLGGLLAVAGSALARRTSRPAVAFAVLSAAALTVSFASPVAAAVTTATALWLRAMHVAVALGAVPVLLRPLVRSAR